MLPELLLPDEGVDVMLIVADGVNEGKVTVIGASDGEPEEVEDREGDKEGAR